MLKRLVILNSEIYSIADIELDGCDSLQIVGPNNIGKSTLIYALNFLFIIDGREMVFSGNRTGDKTTINHYFPGINSSYIVFEIFKQRYYSILVKKNAEGTLEYYKVDTEYKEEHYFIETEKGKKLRKFDDLVSVFTTRGIEPKKFSTRREVFNFVYQKGKNNNAVVWVNQNVNQDGRGISNNFSKIYKYLINSKLINNQSLKQSLIIADNKEGEKVEFKKKNQRDIQKLLKQNSEIKVIQQIEKSFSEFEELVHQYEGKSNVLSELVYAFEELYSTVYSELGNSLAMMKNEKKEQKMYLDETLDPKRSNLNKKVGRIEEQIKVKQKENDQLQDLIKKILSYGSLTFLEQSFRNLDEERKTIETRLTQIEEQKISSAELERKINQASAQIQRLKIQIENYSHQLIHQISSKQEIKEKVNRILSEDITSIMTMENIDKKIQLIGQQMNLFDGIINLPPDLKGKSIASIEDLRNQIIILEREKTVNEKLLPIALNREKFQVELRVIEGKLKVVNSHIEEINNLPQHRETLELSSVVLQNLNEEKEKSNKAIEACEIEINEARKSINSLSTDINKKENRLEKILEWKIDIEHLGIIPTEYQSLESLDNLYKNIKRHIEERKEIKYRKDRLFEKLKDKTGTAYADEYKFIHYINSELQSMVSKERAIEGLLNSISTQFANPCRTIQSRYEEFDAFIKNRFNSRLGKIHISDIDSLKIEIIENEKLMKDLDKISKIRDLTTELIFDDQSDNLNLLNAYLDKQATINFEDLFDIKLHLNRKGRHKVVDLKNQIESDGTDKMIRLVIIMSIINQIVIQDEENKIVLFIDEIGTIDEENRYEILNFCKEYNFIPITAAPLHPYDGFDKYYLLRRGKGKIVVSEGNGNVIMKNAIAVG